MENVRKLAKKTAVITGASKGIGWEITRLFAENGASIIACARSKDKEYENKLFELAEKNSVEVFPIYFDLVDMESIKRGLKDIKGLKKQIDILVNNAGMPHVSLVPMISMEDMLKVFQVNYFAQVQICQSLYRALSKSKGVIINMSSAAAYDGEIGNTVYGASKSCMALFTSILSKEMADVGVRVNGIAPGLINTGFSDAMGEKAKKSMINASSMHRLGLPEEIAKTALFLASEDSSFINGQVLRVDGGM